MSITYDLVKSLLNREGMVNSLDDILGWIQQRNESIEVCIKKVPFSYNGFWHYDESTGYICNDNRSFFQIAGLQEIEDDRIILEQPIILQKEIGYLGIIAKYINGVIHFLMQAKIEPGNVNVIQLSPTLQATKSNFMRAHGGNEPAFLDYFLNILSENIIVDQIQSEQSSRFYKKRNRNMIILVEDEIEILPSHKWMTIGQIIECLKMDNLVNMDTRTVLASIYFDYAELSEDEKTDIQKWIDPELYASIFSPISQINLKAVFHMMNNKKMFLQSRSRMVPLNSLKSWKLTENEIVCCRPYDFKVIYCYIEIEGREVQYWEQPLLESLGKCILGIFSTVVDGVRKFLVHANHEMGCFDTVELGPSIQLEPSNSKNKLNAVESLFLKRMKMNQGILADVILSEEGGRFYHEENRNIIIEVDYESVPLEEDYIWLSFSEIQELIRYNNNVNIQLRNIMTLVFC